MEYLSLYDIRSFKEDIERELIVLLSNKVLVSKPYSLQWRFFRDCINKLFNLKLHSDFVKRSNPGKAQLKFEIEDKLRNYYLKPGKPVNFVFQLVHKNCLKKIFFDDADSYPDLGGYAVLIRDIRNEVGGDYHISGKDFRDYIERVVTDAIEKEFEAYAMLPEIMPDEILNRWFCPSSPAKKEIMHILLRHKEKGWVITNHMNPSTKRILNIKIKKIVKKEIFVSTTEYWYLRWWSTKENSYTYPYKETNRQQYILHKDQGKWKIFEAIRKYPRTSVPNRRIY